MGPDSRGADHKSFIAGSNQMDHFKNIKIINLTFARIYSKSFKIIRNQFSHDFKERSQMVTPTEIQPTSENFRK